MRRTLAGVNAELAVAVRWLNTIHNTIPADRRPDLSGEAWRQLEAELDRACGAGDFDAAMLAIRRWEEHARRVLVAAGGDETQLMTEKRGTKWTSPTAN